MRSKSKERHTCPNSCSHADRTMLTTPGRSCSVTLKEQVKYGPLLFKHGQKTLTEEDMEVRDRFTQARKRRLVAAQRWQMQEKEMLSLAKRKNMLGHHIGRHMLTDISQKHVSPPPALLSLLLVAVSQLGPVPFGSKWPMATAGRRRGPAKAEKGLRDLVPRRHR